MFGDIDDLYFDMDVLSSPIAERTANYPEFTFTDINPPQFELQTYTDITRPAAQEQQFVIDVRSFDLKKPGERQQKIQDSCKPKAKKEALIFHPFASFEATELTVKTLMKRNQKNAVIRL